MRTSPLLLLLAPLVACNGSADDDEGESDTDTDADTDVDTDTDTDVDGLCPAGTDLVESVPWTDRTPSLSVIPQQWNDVAFADANNGWAVGADGSIVRTTDGGSTWTEQTSPTSTWLTGLFVLSADEVWITAEDNNDGAIFHTTDGAQTWTTQVSEQDFFDVDFVDANNGWAVSVGADNVLHTEDGGDTWTAQETPGNSSLERLDFVDTNNGWAVGEGAVYTTTDGGTTWDFVLPMGEDFNATYHSVHFLDADTGYLAGLEWDESLFVHNDPFVLVTEDGGATWTGGTLLDVNDQSIGRGEMKDVFFVDPQVGWVIGEFFDPDGLDTWNMFRTADGGQTWTRQREESGTEGNLGLDAIHFLDADNGIAVGGNAAILTTDAGLCQ